MSQISILQLWMAKNWFHVHKIWKTKRFLQLSYFTLRKCLQFSHCAKKQQELTYIWLDNEFRNWYFSTWVAFCIMIVRLATKWYQATCHLLNNVSTNVDYCSIFRCPFRIIPNHIIVAHSDRRKINSLNLFPFILSLIQYNSACCADLD